MIDMDELACEVSEEAALGKSGEERFVTLCERLGFRARRNPNWMAGSDDVLIVDTDNSEHPAQLKEKSKASKRTKDWVCGRTGRHGPPRLEHGCEADRYDRYAVRRVVVVFGEKGRYLGVVAESSPRWGCHTSCPSYMKHKRSEICQHFVYFDHARLRRIERADDLRSLVVPFVHGTNRTDSER